MSKEKTNKGEGASASSAESLIENEVEETVEDKTDETSSIIEGLKKQIEELTKLVNHSLQMGKFNLDERKSTKAIEQSAQSDIELTRAALLKEDKKTIVIPKGKFDPVGAIETVTINGLRYEIKKGTPVEVPESIYLTLCEYLDIDNRPEVTEKLLDRSEEVIKNLS